MARANTVTWLSLDRWAEILGIDPLHFNQLHSNTIQTITCGSVWFQHPWQDAHRVSREDVALAIASAEQRISNFIGYDLLPTWHTEDLRVSRVARPEMDASGLNVRGKAKSIRAHRGHVISGGIMAKTLIQAGVAITRSDENGDTFDETATAQITTDVADCEIHVYLPGKSGADEWEIRPVEISSAAGVVTMTMKSYQIVDPDLLEDYGGLAVDADDDANYVTTVDVYRIYNDPSVQALMMWDVTGISCSCGLSTCPSCQHATQYGCLIVRDPRLGRLAYQPATWDADTETFTVSQYSLGREPDRIKVYYRAGWQGERPTCPNTSMDLFWELAVTYYAAALLDRNICECTNIQTFVEYWRTDMARNSPEESFQIPFERHNNPFGTTRGAFYARDRCNDPGRRLITA